MHNTIQDAAEEGSRQLLEHDIASARLDAELLLCHVLGNDRAWLLAHSTDELSPEDHERYSNLIAQRTTHTPIAYLTGHKEFFGHDFMVTPAVLIPRPDTEILVESVLEELALLQPQHRSLTLVDVGTGSGCILLSLLQSLNGVKAVGIDISQEALQVAKKNHQRLCPDMSISWRKGHLLAPIAQELHSRGVVVITANLPYIDAARSHELSPDILDHEPHEALFAAEEGSGLHKELLDQLIALEQERGISFVLHIETAPYNMDHILAHLPATWTASTYRNLAQQTLFARISNLHP